jgi:adenylylsulfate kinase
MSDIHPIYSRMISRAEREKKLRQRAKVVWLYGLSGSGKSTLTTALEHRLFADGFVTDSIADSASPMRIARKISGA